MDCIISRCHPVVMGALREKKSTIESNWVKFSWKWVKFLVFWRFFDARTAEIDQKHRQNGLYHLTVSSGGYGSAKGGNWLNWVKLSQIFGKFDLIWLNLTNFHPQEQYFRSGSFGVGPGQRGKQSWAFQSRFRCLGTFSNAYRLGTWFFGGISLVLIDFCTLRCQIFKISPTLAELISNLRRDFCLG